MRVYADGDGGKELAFVSFVIGTAVLPQSQVTSTLSQASQATSEASGEMPVESEAQSDPNSAQSSENSRWFTDEVLSEMKLTGFTLPEGFVVLTDEELPDNMENDPYFRAIKGSPDMDGYHPLIQNAWNILKTNYGEVYTWNYYPDDLPSYKWESVMHYGGDPFFVWQEELIRSVAFTFSGTWGSGVEGTVLQIRLQPDADDPRNDYNWQ